MRKLLSLSLIFLAAMMACDNNPTSTPNVIVPITIISPDNGTYLSDSQNIVAAAGSGYSFIKIDFYIDTVLVHTDSTAPYQYFWNIFTYDPEDIHALYVIADSGENDYMSDVVLVGLDFEQGLSHIGSYQPGSQNAIGIVNYDNVLFVAEGDAGIEMLDIRDKTAPQFLSRFNAGGLALHTDILYPLVLIAYGSQGMISADFSDIDTMISDGVFNSPSAVDVAVAGDYIYLAENDGVTVLEQDGDDFNSLGRIAFQDVLKYVVARHDTAFVVGNSGFYIVDSGHDLVGSYNSLSLARAVAVVDTFAFIANGNGGVIALSIEDPTDPRFLALFNPGQIMVAVDAGDGFLFAGAQSGMVYVLNYSTPGQLIEVEHLSTTNQLAEIDYELNHIYIAAHSNVDILRFVP